jgi:hypothetical protein
MVDVGPTVPLDTIPAFDFESADVGENGFWARLVPLASNKGVFTEIELIREEHTFGRLSTCDTVFKELGVSGKHCRIYRETITSTKTSATIIKLEDMRYVAFNVWISYQLA